jgi:Ribonuclease G/E
VKGRAIALHPLAEGRGAAALVVDGRVEDLLADPPAPGPEPEDVHWAKVERVVPNIGAGFVTLGGGETGWLHAPGLKAGEMRLVQVSRFADPGKAVPVSDRAVWKGRLAMLTPGVPGANVARSVRRPEARERLSALAARALEGAPETLGAVLRTAAAEADEDEVLEEAAALRADLDEALEAAAGPEPRRLRRAPGAAARAFRDWEAEAADDAPDAFDRLGVWETLRGLASPRAELPGGGWLSAEATAALVAVDVNTGGDFSKGSAQRANLAACAELPRQLRLRGLGGLVYVDFAPVKKGARQGIDAALKRAFAADPVETSQAGWTPLGKAELTRRRERAPLGWLIREAARG